MKRLLPFTLLLILFGDYKEFNPNDSREEYTRFLEQHPFNQRERLTPEQLTKMDKKDRPDLAWEQNFLQTLDPASGEPATERLLPVYEQIKQFKNNMLPVPGAAGAPWAERGPDNVAGRIRALMFDPNDPSGNKVWAGGVTGGLWYNNDITNPNSSWTAVNDFWDNIAVTAIAYDPTNTNVFYVGTGEGWGQSYSGARGGGIWKTTDGGVSWNHLAATSSFYFVNDLAVRNESGNGVLYVALRSYFYGGTFHGSSEQGVQRSTDGGTSFTQVLPNVPGQTINFAAADIEIAADNRIWVGTTTSSFSASDQGGGRILYSDNGTSWTIANSTTNGDRVEVACAPNDANYVYALVEVSNQLGEVLQTTNKGVSWTSVSEPNDADNNIPATDFTRGQAWYDLILAVDPNDKNTLIAGGIDLFRSTDGGGNWSQISKWSNNNNLAFLTCALVHADQHAIVFKPGSSSEVIFGTDGGVYYTNSIATAATNSVINGRKNGHNVTQFYACAIHPTAATDYFLGGTQDNGTQQYNSAGMNSTVEVTGGDGAYCFIDQTNPSYQITSFIYNSYWLSTNAGSSFGNRFQNDQGTGKFINPADYDDNLDILYSARTNNTINRVTGISSTPSIGNFTVSGMGSMASHLRVSPYTVSSTTLFIGTDAGNLFKITNADGGSPSATSIGSPSFPNGSISCVDIGASENELLVTFFNYGVTSVWYTDNGGTSWSNKEGNLPDMPVRWALFNPNNRNEVILATEVGVWSSTDFNNANPTWNPSNSGLANVRVDMLQMRDSDQEVIAATHGRGIFSSSGFNANLPPVADFEADIIYPCLGETVSLSDNSSNSPTSWTWSISPSTFTFVNSTNSNSQNPQIQLNALGTYTITLTVSNANGMDTKTLTSYIRAGGLSLPYFEDFETNTTNLYQVENPDNLTTWALTTVAGNSPGNTAVWVDNFNYNAPGQRDGLISPSIDINNYTSATLNFEYAYRRYDNSNQDSLAVFISTDCGVSWNRLASFRENGSGNFVTGSDLTTAFTPSVAADWCGNTGNPSCPSLSLDAYVGNTIKLRFENINGWGNNLYLDNINVSGSQVLAPVADFTASSTSVCPNDIVTFTDVSTNSPNSWNWSFSPSTVSYVNGTSATSQNPEVAFTNPGSYNVTLTSGNTAGSNSNTKMSYMVVNASVIPGVSIAASQTIICPGDNVTFTATPVNGGSSPSYQWKVNGMNMGNNSPGFNSNTLQNGDVVTVEMTSNAGCVTTANATSNSINIVVTAPLTPAVTIAANTAITCEGEMITFTATPTNGGANPSYQWRVNGIVSGTNASTFSTPALQNGDQVVVRMTPSITCVTASQVNSNLLTITVNPLPAVSINTVLPIGALCKQDNPFSLSANPTGGSWSGPGVSGTFFNPVAAGDGLHKLVYTYTDANNCSAKDSIDIPVEIVPKPTISRNGTTLTCDQAGFNYQWFRNGAPLGGANNQSYSVTANGNYTVQIGTGSCSDLSDSEAVNDIGIEEFKNIYGFEIYPNPARDLVSMKFINPGESVMKYELIAFNGAVVKKEEIYLTAIVEKEIDLSDLANGIYTVRVFSDNKLYFTEKINKQ